MITKRILLALMVIGGVAVLGVVTSVQPGRSGASAEGQFLGGSWFFLGITEVWPPVPHLVIFTQDLVGPGVKGSFVGTVWPGRVAYPNPDGQLLVQPTVIGEWMLIGEREFAVTYELLLLEVGWAVGEGTPFFTTARLRGTIKLNETLDRFSGRAIVEILDPDRNVIGSVPGTIEDGRRIGVKPLD